MATFLLWNVNKQPLDGLVENLVTQHRVDVVLLVEYAFGLSQLGTLLAKQGLFKAQTHDRFGVFVRSNHALTNRTPVAYRTRAELWTLTPPSGQEGTLALVHGFDRRNYDDATRRMLFRRVVDGVRAEEGRCQHARTLIAGDFNAQPYDPAVVAADGLHALGVHAIRKKSRRSVSGVQERLDFFYNPM